LSISVIKNGNLQRRIYEKIANQIERQTGRKEDRHIELWIHSNEE